MLGPENIAVIGRGIKSQRSESYEPDKIDADVSWDGNPLTFSRSEYASSVPNVRVTVTKLAERRNLGKAIPADVSMSGEFGQVPGSEVASLDVARGARERGIEKLFERAKQEHPSGKPGLGI